MRWSWGEDPAPLHECLAVGGVLGLPTESSYALGVDPRSEAAVASVFALKQRACGEPLGVVVADEEQAAALGVDTSSAGFRAALEVWPAALNVLVEVDQPLPAMAGAELLSIRIPEHLGLRSVLYELETGLTATSANLSGTPPMLDPEALEQFLGQGASAHCVVDDGVLPGGLPSTMVIWENDAFRVLRPGRTTL